MKKFILICFLASFIFGIAQEKKISFAQEVNYKLVDKNTPLGSIKTYSGKNNEFLTQIKVSVNNFPMLFYTDALGTTSVSLDMNNHLDGSDVFAAASNMGMYENSFEDKQEYVLESKKLNTQETILGVPCSHYLINYKLKNGEKQKKEDFKLCIDEKSSYNNYPVLNGLLNYFEKRSKYKGSGLKGSILKGGPEKTYDTEYFVATSINDSKDVVYFDHKKAMTDQQRKKDSVMVAFQKREAEYTVDSAATVADSAAVAIAEPADYADHYAHIPDYISNYKSSSHEDGGLALSNITNDKLWNGLPKHCKNFEKELPTFHNKELKGHLKNYVGQVCDMYLTQAGFHTVEIKITLDEIRREVLYLNEIQGKLDASDKKKLNNYLKNLD